MQQEIFFKKITEIVNKPGVDAIKYAILYSKKRVEPAKYVFFFYFYLKIKTICEGNNVDQ